MTQLTKVINFRVPFDVYEAFNNESKKDNVTLTDCILKKLRKSEKADEYLERIHNLEELNKSLIESITNLTIQVVEYSPYKYAKGGVVNGEDKIYFVKELIKELQKELDEDKPRKIKPKKIKKDIRATLGSDPMNSES